MFFSDQFSKIAICYKRKGNNIDVIKQSVCLAIDPITVDYFAQFFNCPTVGRGSDSRMARLKNYLFRGISQNFLCLFLALRGSPGVFILVGSSIPVDTLGISGYLNTLFLLSPNLCFIIDFISYLLVARKDALIR